MKRALILLLVALLLWVLWGNTAVEVNEWAIGSEELPREFDGFRIAQVSDLHNAEFGDGNERLLKLLRQAEPDVIVITGDVVDSRNTDVSAALDFAEAAVEIAPCYYVSGNHESRIGAWTELREGFKAAGAAVLENEKVTLERGGGAVTLLGLQDPSFGMDTASVLRRLMAGEEGYTILLSHRPELFVLYAACGVDLVFSGHAHGGQVRLPFAGGLAAPNQGFFPEYDSGRFDSGGTTMLVSRGLGNSMFPLRIFNRPEILVVQLEAA